MYLNIDQAEECCDGSCRDAELDAILKAWKWEVLWEKIVPR